MRRRDIVAGVASLGVLSGSAGLLYNGVPSIGDNSATTADSASDGPVAVETIDARGSEAGTVSVPSDRVLVITFFVTGCGQCQTQIPKLATAHDTLTDQHGSDIRFLSVTYQSIGRLPADDLREWWAAHDGNWAVGYDPDSTLSASYGVVGYPVTVVIDTDGRNRWQETGVQRSETIVDAVETVMESSEP